MTDAPEGLTATLAVAPQGQGFAMVRRSPAARIMVVQNLPALVARLGGVALGDQ